MERTSKHFCVHCRTKSAWILWKILGQSRHQFTKNWRDDLRQKRWHFCYIATNFFQNLSDFRCCWCIYHSQLVENVSWKLISLSSECSKMERRLRDDDCSSTDKTCDLQWTLSFYCLLQTCNCCEISTIPLLTGNCRNFFCCCEFWRRLVCVGLLLFWGILACGNDVYNYWMSHFSFLSNFSYFLTSPVEQNVITSIDAGFNKQLVWAYSSWLKWFCDFVSRIAIL